MDWLERIFSKRGSEVSGSASLTLPQVPGSSIGEQTELLARIMADANFSEPLPALDADVLLQRHATLLAKLYETSGFARDDFDRLLLPLVQRFSEYVQLLPASETHHHFSIGGLLEHSLEVCVIAIRRAQGVSFCGDKQGRERALDKVRWPICCGIAGLLHDLGKAVYDQLVRSADGHEIWNPYRESLIEFAARAGGYRTAWRRRRQHKLHELAGVSLVPDILHQDLKVWITEGDRVIFPVLVMAIAGYENPDHPATYAIVHDSDKESVNRYMAKMHLGSPAPALDEASGSTTDTVLAEDQIPKEPVIAVQPQEEKSASTGDFVVSPSAAELVASSPASNRFIKLLPEYLSQRKWIVNERDRERGLFWYDGEQAWVSWPALYNAVVSAFEADAFKAYPRARGVFFDMLITSGVLMRSAGEYTAEITITPAGGRSFSLSMARIADKAVMQLLAKYAEKAVTLNLKDVSGLVQSAHDTETKANDEINPVQSHEIFDLTRSSTPAPQPSPEISDKAVDSASITQEAFAEYVKALDNNDIKWLRSQGESGECLEEICSALGKGKLKKEDYGLLGGSLWLRWPQSASYLGDDDKVMLAALSEAGMLRDAKCQEFDVQPDGRARIMAKGRPLSVMAISPTVTAKMRNAYGLNNDFSLDQALLEGKKEAQVNDASKPKVRTEKTSPLPPSPPKKALADTSANLPAAKKKERPAVKKQAADEQAKQQEKGKAQKSGNKAYPVPEVFHALDTFIDRHFKRYEHQFLLREKAVGVQLLSLIYRDAVGELDGLQENWYARLLSADGVVEQSVQLPTNNLNVQAVIIPETYLPKTIRQLAKSREGESGEPNQ